MFKIEDNRRLIIDKRMIGQSEQELLHRQRGLHLIGQFWLYKMGRDYSLDIWKLRREMLKQKQRKVSLNKAESNNVRRENQQYLTWTTCMFFRWRIKRLSRSLHSNSLSDWLTLKITFGLLCTHCLTGSVKTTWKLSGRP